MMVANGMKLQEGEVYGFKLHNGEEVVAKILTISSTDIMLIDPHTIMMSQGGAALAPWPMLREEKTNAPITRSSIISFFKCREDFKGAYEELIAPPAEAKPAIFMPPEKKIIR